MDQDQQEQQHRHVCKHCNKSFANGKVLGGHMRCHVAKNPSKSQKKSVEEACGDRTGYGLRVNPKKSSRVSASGDQETPSSKEIPCGVCGKEFDSMRALFGHMRHHSVKRRREACSCRECGREFETPRALACHMKSHSRREPIVGDEKRLFVESSGLVKRKRSRRSRHKVSPNSSVLNLSESLNNFGEVDGGVEEIAMCLLMLSRGVWSRDEFCSGSEFSDDNNSSGFEVKSPNRSKRVLENGDESLNMVMMKRPRIEELEFGISGCDEGFLGDKKLHEFPEDDEETEGLSLGVFDQKSGGDFEVEKESDGLGMRVIINPVEMESDGNLVKSFSSEKSGFDPDSSLINSGPETLESYQRKSEYKCRTCNKIFLSHQALGGHQTVHRSTKAYLAPQFDDFPVIEDKCNAEDSVEFEAERLTVTSCESNKEHKCHICFKVFSSGQALGGHKRAHIVKDSEAEAEHIPLLSHEVCGISGHVLDTDVELKSASWWVRNNHKHELLLGLMPN